MAAKTKTDVIRDTIKMASLSGAEVVTTPELAAMTGAKTESEKQVIRKIMSELTRMGELEKVGHGCWRPTGKEPDRRGSGYIRMWRAVRSSAGCICAADISKLTTMERSTASKYLRYLHDAELIRPAMKSKSGCTLYYAITEKGRAQRKTPYPIKPIAEPYRSERIAAAALCRIMLLEDINSERIQEKIKAQIQILANAFMGGATQTINQSQEEKDGNRNKIQN